MSVPSKVEPLQIVVKPEANPMHLRRWNYFGELRDFMKSLASQIVTTACGYPNPTSAWECAPIIVTKDGPPWGTCYVYVRPVNYYMVRNHFRTQMLEHELPKTAPSKCYSKF